MVRLYEYQGKQLLKTVKVPIPEGDVASTKEEARTIAERVAAPVAVKAQIWATGRFKAGGIKFADTPEETVKAAGELLGAEIKGFKVEKVLVEKKLDIEKEFYAGVIVDSSRNVRAPVVMFSSEGGVDIEEVAQRSPEKVSSMTVDIFRGVKPYDAINLALKVGVPTRLLRPVSGAIRGIYEVFSRYDARAAEINPLVLTKDGQIVAADCRVTIDDSSVFRHPEFGIEVARESDKPPTELDKIAWTIERGDYRGVCFFAQMAPDEKGPGYVGYHGIGGGGAILGVDALNRQGLKIANYADTSGNPTAAKVYRCAKVILSQPNIEGYILAGHIVANQEQWHHAHGVVKALREELADKPGYPVVLLLCGNKEKESLEILKEGLADLPIRLEIYGSEHVYNSEFIAKRMRALVDEYRRERGVS
ncbi:MAG: ATP-grasp domain-containing protein [Candidatus Geothermarchaeales archaeon]